MTLKAASQAYKGAGLPLTYVGSEPGQVVYWELVGLDQGVEVSAEGSLKFAFTITDQAGLARNFYFAPPPASELEAERIKTKVYLQPA